MAHTSQRDNVLPFPLQPGMVDTAARRAVRNLLYHQLITEPEAVRVLVDLGAADDEIDLVRTMAAVVRR